MQGTGKREKPDWEWMSEEKEAHMVEKIGQIWK